jgi:predicted membrane protein
MIMQYVTGPLLVPYFVLQFAVGAIFPMLLLSYMIWRGTTDKALIVGVTLSACLVMFSVFMMRWNVVIGGQEISKTGKGLLSYHLRFLGQEGALVAILLVLAPLAVLVGMVRLFPPWEDHASHAAPAAS